MSIDQDQLDEAEVKQPFNEGQQVRKRQQQEGYDQNQEQNQSSQISVYWVYK